MTDTYDYSHLLIEGNCDCGDCSDPSAIEPDCGSSFICRYCDKRWSADFGCDGDTPGLCDSCAVRVQEGWEATEAEDRAEFAPIFASRAPNKSKYVTVSRAQVEQLLLECRDQDTVTTSKVADLFPTYQ
jgi:hypothetical protein